LFHERPIELDPGLEANGGVPVDGDVPAATKPLRPELGPDGATPVGNGTAESGGGNLAANNGQGDAGTPLEDEGAGDHGIMGTGGG
jgi:hypothetical protein